MHGKLQAQYNQERNVSGIGKPEETHESDLFSQPVRISHVGKKVYSKINIFCILLFPGNGGYYWMATGHPVPLPVMKKQ